VSLSAWDDYQDGGGECGGDQKSREYEIVVSHSVPRCYPHCSAIAAAMPVSVVERIFQRSLPGLA
jgi:hypothetical protein